MSNAFFSCCKGSTHQNVRLTKVLTTKWMTECKTTRKRWKKSHARNDAYNWMKVATNKNNEFGRECLCMWFIVSNANFRTVSIHFSRRSLFFFFFFSVSFVSFQLQFVYFRSVDFFFRKSHSRFICERVWWSVLQRIKKRQSKTWDNENSRNENWMNEEKTQTDKENKMTAICTT